MDAPPPERPRAVTIVGWIWLVAAALRFVNGLLGLVVWKVGGLDRGLPFLPERMGGVEVRVVGMEAMMGRATEILVAQVLVSGFVAFAAFELLRLKAWSRTAIDAVSWLGIAGMAGLGVYVYASTARLALESPAEAATIRMAGAGAGVFIAVLGAAFFGGTIYFLRRADVRRAFAPSDRVEPS